jgi:hypothetical protein
MAKHTFRRFALLLGAVALSANGIAATPYEIALRNGSTVLSRSQPVRYGTVLVFRATDGRLTGLPVEEVTAVQAHGATKGAKATTIRTTTTTTRVTAAPSSKALEPGGTLVLGPTGEGSVVTPEAEATIGANPAPGMASASGAAPIYGGGGPARPGTVATQPGTAVSQQTTGFPNAPVTAIGPDGLPRGLGSGPPPTAGANTALNPPGTTMSPAGATPPGSNIEPTGTTNPRGSGTASPAGSTPPGSNIEPSGTSNPRGSGTTAPAGSVPPGAAAPPPAAPPPPPPPSSPSGR